MKKVYQLSYRTEKGLKLNVLFSSKYKANKVLMSFYSVGQISPADDSKIVTSYIIERTLF